METKFNIFEILEIAERIDHNGAIFYLKTAELFDDPELQNIYYLLANWRAKHEKILALRRKHFSEKTGEFGTFDPDNYVLSNPNIHCVLSGMQSVDEIDYNITTACNERYTPKELELINDVITRSRNEHLTYCTGCGYCLPCTQGIDIPQVIKIWNQINMVKGENLFNRDYQMLDITADCCIKCRICEEKCPNEIVMSEIMGKVSGLLE